MLNTLVLHLIFIAVPGRPAGALDNAVQIAPALDTISSPNACVPGTSPRQPGCVPVSGSVCVVTVNRSGTNVKVTDASRRACLPLAQVIESNVPIATDANMRDGQPSDIPISATADVHCRLKPRPESGGSLKFRCMRTNAHNQLYDDGGEIVPGAVGFDAGGDLLDAAGAKLLDEDGKPREGDELRVKYFVGPHPEMRYREMFTETVVSRLFWALGIPVDRVYMPASVRCMGCTAAPFGQKAASKSPIPQVFTLASIERPYSGKTISMSRSKGFLWFGGKYDHGFGFDEIGIGLLDAPTLRRVELEVMAIALNLIAYNNTHSYQNDLICRKGAWDKATGECSEVVAYVSDVGGSLGGATAWWVEGMPAPAMKRHPRGDYMTFSRGSVFTSGTACTLRYPIGTVRAISEAARQMIDDRIRGRLGREQLRIIFEAANIHRMDAQVTERLAATLSLQPGAELDHAVQLLWADEMLKRFGEILTRRCQG